MYPYASSLEKNNRSLLKEPENVAHALFYCAPQQIDDVVSLLGNELGLLVSKFTEEESLEERKQRRIGLEQKKYQEAIGEYRRLLRLYPNGPFNYKAWFMIGFVYSEYLKDTKKANVAFQKVISMFPNCDLADDAEFMLKGGEIPVLEDETENTLES